MISMVPYKLLLYVSIFKSMFVKEIQEYGHLAMVGNHVLDISIILSMFLNKMQFYREKNMGMLKLLEIMFWLPMC